jgi:hypothetical protein
MTSKLLIALFTLPFLAYGQSANATGPIVSLYFPEFDPQPFAASVIDANPTATTFLVGCVAGTDASDCGLPPYGITYTKIGSTEMGLFMTVPNQYTETDTCTYATNSGANCVFSISSLVSEPTTSIPSSVAEPETFNATDVVSCYFPVTITAGADKLASASATATTTGGAKTASGGSTVASQTAKPSNAAGNAGVSSLALGLAAVLMAL